MPLPQRVRIAEQLIHRLAWDEIDRAAVRRLVELARDEAQSGANAGGIARVQTASVDLVGGRGLVFCGASLLPLVAHAFGLRGGLHIRTAEGTGIDAGTVVATLSGPGPELDAASRVALAFVSRLSGVATFARRHTDALGGGRTRLLDNGATTPGWAALERFALGCGGAWSGGDGAARIRIDAAGFDRTALESAVRRARNNSPDVPLELTVHRPGDIDAALAVEPDLLRLAWFDTGAIREAVARVGGRVFVEAHGGITIENIGGHAGLGLDFVSADDLATGAAPAPFGRAWRD